MERECKGTTKGGEPCRMPPLEGAGYCWAHSPENARERDEARRRGGQNRRTPKANGAVPDGEVVEYRTVEAIQSLLERTVADTLLQENSDKRSRTVATLAQVLMKSLEVGDLDERLAALEAALPRKQRA